MLLSSAPGGIEPAGPWNAENKDREVIYKVDELSNYHCICYRKHRCKNRNRTPLHKTVCIDSIAHASYRHMLAADVRRYYCSSILSSVISLFANRLAANRQKSLNGYRVGGGVVVGRGNWQADAAKFRWKATAAAR